MASKQKSPEKKLPTTLVRLGVSLNPSGQDGCAVHIPADVKNELDLEPGKNGDTVDLEYDREAEKLEVYF